MEGSPSGLWRRLGKAVCGQLHRGFESLSLRQEYNSDPTRSLKASTKRAGRFLFCLKCYEISLNVAFPFFRGMEFELA